MKNRYQKKKVWDSVTRVWHWMLVVSVTAGWILGEFRSFSVMSWHIYFGYFTGILLLWRILWGIIGPEYIQFRSLVPQFSDIHSYMMKVGRREPSGVAGHSPIGAIFICIMLLLLVTQVVSGLFSEDDSLFYSGPFAKFISTQNVNSITSIHTKGSELLLIFVGGHISAVFFYLIWKKENLIKPMFIGWKLVRLDNDKTSQDK